MDSGFAGIVVIALIGFALMGGLAYLSYLAAKKRREAFAAWAAARGWTYAERDDRIFIRFSGAPFWTGDDRRAQNVLTGKHSGRHFTAFDYRYSTTEHTRDAQGRTSTRTVVHDFSVIAAEVGARVPALSVAPQGFFDRLADLVLDNDIDLESEDFNRAFTVHCPDRKFATDVLDPRMMEYLLTLPDLAWGFHDGALVTIEPGQHSVESLTATLDAIDGILDRVPEFVWKQVSGDDGTANGPGPEQTA